MDGRCNCNVGRWTEDDKKAKWPPRPPRPPRRKLKLERDVVLVVTRIVMIIVMITIIKSISVPRQCKDAPYVKCAERVKESKSGKSRTWVNEIIENRKTEIL